MIEIKNINTTEPYSKFLKFYNQALKANQSNIEAIAISSFNKSMQEVESRFVNIKYILNNEWIFFTNYSSKKSQDFTGHKQISSLFFWHTINVQIRMKAVIKKTQIDFNQIHFNKRTKEKNALAVSSKQSQKIDTYEEVKNNFNSVLEKQNFDNCPEYWGGYSFVPYYFEFWEGHETRINKRNVYELINGNWRNYILQP